MGAFDSTHETCVFDEKMITICLVPMTIFQGQNTVEIHPQTTYGSHERPTTPIPSWGIKSVSWVVGCSWLRSWVLRGFCGSFGAFLGRSWVYRGFRGSLVDVLGHGECLANFLQLYAFVKMMNKNNYFCAVNRFDLFRQIRKPDHQ